MYREELNEIWYALHQNIEAEKYSRWDELCTAMSFIEQALGHESFEAEDPISVRLVKEDHNQIELEIEEEFGIR
tara:strand:+ start:248 stop:469 length:222 start_codon:yes stop_codon:yes gene_type:complete